MRTSPASSLRTPAVSALEHFLWHRPGWWSLALCALAWAVMLVHGWRHAGHATPMRAPFGIELVLWMLMVCAMMLPVVQDGVQATAEGSLWKRRHRAISGFLLGYLAPWLVLGALVAVLLQATGIRTLAAPALGFAFGALWQLTPLHRHALVACHSRRPLAPDGWPADLSCLRSGGVIGAACVSSCWPLMLACALSAHDLVAMIGGTAVVVAERASFRPRIGLASLGALAISGYYALRLAAG